ncbi:MAG: hypothetical protein J0I43_01235 [Microbacterium sp.]|uniref:hypothetical protein n=1 Tax=Microbacterium sp. TaxID=51671 RepID=UPI001AC14680|nr:hypothetical protein [Microbacterium sp.]MBN9175984.1 hypothetical protein [Microbacterium sp.]
MSENLCDGPRGRRLVLELARDVLPEEARRGLGELAYQADVDAGSSITRLVFSGHGAAEPDPPSTTAELAAAIRAIGVLEPAAVDSTAFDAAMLRAVDSARYWQAPEGADIVAAHPVVAAALAEVAVALPTGADATWWRRDRTAQQWAIEFDPSGDGAPFDPAPTASARWSASTAAEEERARAEYPADVTAPFGGQWWSHPWGAPHSTGVLPAGVPAGIPYVEDGFGWTRALAIPVAGAGRTYEVRGADDWAHLCRTYPREVTAARRHDWYSVTGRDGRWLLPDWGRVAGEWDAVHLSAWGYLTAATREIVVDAEYSSMIAGWGPDETYWLTGLVREIEGPRVHWRADRPEGPWRRAE